MKAHKILYVGSLTERDTSFHRMLAMRQLGYEVYTLDTNKFLPKGFELAIQYRLGIGRMVHVLNQAILKEVSMRHPDLVWFDKALFVTRETLISLQSLTKTVHLNPDDPFGMHRIGWRIFNRAIPYYDLHFVSRPQNISEYLSRGAKRVFEYDRSFSPDYHRPLSMEEMQGVEKFDVGFVGSYAPQRARSIDFLHRNNYLVHVFGSGWDKHKIEKRYKSLFSPPVVGIHYARTLNAMRIALHFLRRENRDEQDSRTFEIPACKTFMLAERSGKHEQLFAEGKEAVFFDNDQDLLEKLNYYLTHVHERDVIANAGYHKSVAAGYDHLNRLRQLIGLVERQID